MRRPLRTVHGNRAGAMARRVYACAACGVWHEAKPAQCRGCGLMEFVHFPSRAEARRFAELKLQQTLGRISGLRCQVPFDLHVGAVKIGRYVADFVWYDGPCAGGGAGQIVEDVKLVDTPLSKWKRRHAEAEHGIKIQVVSR